MTEAMLAAVLVKPGRFELRDLPRPEPSPDQVLIRVKQTGICGTDLHIFHGRYAAEKLPMIPGHEFTGKISDTGCDVEGLSRGQPVVVDVNHGCGRCYWCRRNEILNCPQMQQLGITTDGAFAQYICVPAKLVIPAPAGISAEILTLVEPLACVVRAARKARVTFAQSVVVLGAGPIGNLHVQLLRTLGAAPIVVVDICQERVEMALNAGADVGISDMAQLEEKVLSVTDGRGADVVVESVGLPQLYAQSVRLMRKGGHLAAFGLTSAGESLSIDIMQTILQENSLKGSVAGMGEDMHDALTLLVHGRINTRYFGGAEYPLENIQEAFDSFGDRQKLLKTRIIM